MNISPKAIFLDRDGVLIHEVNYLSSLSDIYFYSDVPQGLRALKKAGYLLIVVTNQSGVARGFFPVSFVEECHHEMNRILADYKVELDHLYFCPHHEDGFAPYNIPCICRKPEPGMISQAVEDLQLDLECSVMIGDKLSDVELAINAGVEGILLTTGHGMNAVDEVTAKYPLTPVFRSFGRAVDYILKRGCI